MRARRRRDRLRAVPRCDQLDALVDRLRVEKSVLIVPGDHFGMDGYLRIGSAVKRVYLRDGLDRLDHLLRSLPAAAAVK